MVSVKHEMDELKTDSAKPARNAPLVGQNISHYRVLSVLGGGRTGVVYKGEDLKLNRPVALKFLTKDLAQTPSVLKQLEHEARTASSLNHPNAIMPPERRISCSRTTFTKINAFD